MAYWHDIAIVDGQPCGAFSLVRTGADSGSHVLTMYFGPVAGFADGLAAAQDRVTINGEPALAFFTVAEVLDELGG